MLTQGLYLILTADFYFIALSFEMYLLFNVCLDLDMLSLVPPELGLYCGFIYSSLYQLASGRLFFLYSLK